LIGRERFFELRRTDHYWEGLVHFEPDESHQGSDLTAAVSLNCLDSRQAGEAGNSIHRYADCAGKRDQDRAARWHCGSQPHSPPMASVHRFPGSVVSNSIFDSANSHQLTRFCRREIIYPCKASADGAPFGLDKAPSIKCDQQERRPTKQRKQLPSRPGNASWSSTFRGPKTGGHLNPPKRPK